MKCNVGKSDRILRIVLGVLLLGGAIYFQATFGMIVSILLGAWGAIMLITGLTRRCLMYVPFKIDTSKGD